ncbi:hypothetical protein PtB15_8B160 [Puccinia triticina]|nr:hypothetical protein PtB15_8B160 [Puccinia triticina]
MDLPRGLGSSSHSDRIDNYLDRVLANMHMGGPEHNVSGFCVEKIEPQLEASSFPQRAEILFLSGEGVRVQPELGTTHDGASSSTGQGLHNNIPSREADHPATGGFVSNSYVEADAESDADSRDDCPPHTIPSWATRPRRDVTRFRSFESQITD